MAGYDLGNGPIKIQQGFSGLAGDSLQDQQVKALQRFSTNNSQVGGFAQKLQGLNNMGS